MKVVNPRPVMFTAMLVMSATVIGCAEPTKPVPAKTAKAKVEVEVEVDDVAAERAKLSAEDRAMVDAQEWCVIMQDERLGSMGPPVKLTIKDKTVFVCCKSCQKKVEADPDKAIAGLDELKTKKKQQGGTGK